MLLSTNNTYRENFIIQKVNSYAQDHKVLNKDNKCYTQFLIISLVHTHQEYFRILIIKLINLLNPK